MLFLLRLQTCLPFQIQPACRQTTKMKWNTTKRWCTHTVWHQEDTKLVNQKPHVGWILLYAPSTAALPSKGLPHHICRHTVRGRFRGKHLLHKRDHIYSGAEKLTKETVSSFGSVIGRVCHTANHQSTTNNTSAPSTTFPIFVIYTVPPVLWGTTF